MHVSVIELAPATVAGLRYVGPYGPPIGRFWLDRYVPWAVENRLGPDHARYGIVHDDPAATPAHACRYDACAAVEPGALPAGAEVTASLPGGHYAVLDFRGTAATIAAAWETLLRDWLPAHGLRRDDRPCFEYYPPAAYYDPDTGEFGCQVCVPIASR